MGGRAAEELLMGEKEVSTGCSNDLQKATEIAYNFVMRYGMNEDFSLLALQEKGYYFTFI
jgi:ATP-dependent Zn protease